MTLSSRHRDTEAQDMLVGEVNCEFKFDDTSVCSDLFITDRSLKKTDLGLSRAWINVCEPQPTKIARRTNSEGSAVSSLGCDTLPGYTEVTLVPKGSNGSLAILGNGWFQLKINNGLLVDSCSEGQDWSGVPKILIAEPNNDMFFEKKPDIQSVWLRYRDKSGELSSFVNGIVIVEKFDFVNKVNGTAIVSVRMKLNAVTFEMSSGERYIFSGRFRAEGVTTL